MQPRVGTIRRAGRLAVAGLLASTAFFDARIGLAADATWLANPANGNFANGANWSTGTKPDGTDVATFGASTITTIAVPVPGAGPTGGNDPATGFPIATIGAFVFNPGAAAYTFDFNPTANGSLDIIGHGIDNNSGVTQTFDNHWNLRFRNFSTADNATFTGGGPTFRDNSTAANSVMNVLIGPFFAENATAANSTINLLPAAAGFGVTANFGGSATAANAIINGQNSAVDAATGASFGGGSTAGNAQITVNRVQFFGTSNAGNATINVGTGIGGFTGQVDPFTFSDQSNAGSAQITANAPGVVFTAFDDNATAGSATIVSTHTLMTFEDSSSAGTAHITVSGFTTFEDSSTAGAGTIINNGGSLAFTNNSAATGTTIVTNAGLQFRNNATITNGTVTVNSGANVRMRDFSEGAGTRFIANAGGIVDFSDLDDASVAVGTIEGAGVVYLGGKTTIVGGANQSATFSGVVEDCGAANQCFGNAIGGALTKVGTGTLVLEGTNLYTGATTVNAGRLVVNGSIASSSGLFLNGGAVGGTGFLPDTVVNGGTLAPGNSIGTINVASVTFNAGSTLEIEVSAAGQSDLIAAAGTATINGGTVAVLATPDGVLFGTPYTILTAAGGVTGTFAGVTANLAFLAPRLIYNAGNVQLLFERNLVSFCAVGQTFNQCSTGAASEQLGLGSAIFGAIMALDATGARAAFDQLSGEVHASLGGVLVEDSRFLRDAASARVRAAFAAGAAGAVPVMAYGPDGLQAASADTELLAVWADAFGSWGTWDGDGNAAGLNRSLGGLLIGADGFVADNVRLGVLGGYSHTSFNVGARNSSGNATGYHLGLFTGGEWSGFGLTGGAAYSWHNVEISRSVTFPGFTDTLSADYRAGTFQAFGEVSYTVRLPGVKLEPFAGLAHVSVSTGGFVEMGGAAALVSARSTTDLTFGTLGLRASAPLPFEGVEATASGMVGWRHAFGNVVPQSSFAFAGGGAFPILGVPIARDVAVVEAGLDFRLSSATSFGVSYSGQFGSGVSDHSANARFAVRF